MDAAARAAEHSLGHSLGHVVASAASSGSASVRFVDAAAWVNAEHAEEDAGGVGEAAYAGGEFVDVAAGTQVGSLAGNGGSEMVPDPC
jgi:hypothetical protein